MSSASHAVLMDCGFLTFGLSNSVDLVCDFASKGKEQEEALRMDEGLLLDAKRRLDNLVAHLGLVKVKEAA